jgi:hypothetical protein
VPGGGGEEGAGRADPRESVHSFMVSYNEDPEWPQPTQRQLRDCVQDMFAWYMREVRRGVRTACVGAMHTGSHGMSCQMHEHAATCWWDSMRASINLSSPPPVLA